MKKLALLSLFVILAISQNSFAVQDAAHDTDECYISFIEYSGNKYVVKQIKNPSPDEQFLLVLDSLGCFIAEVSDIPMNKVKIIPPNVPFPGKRVLRFPATLHTLANGVSTDKECLYQDVDIHQRFRKEETLMWHCYGPLPVELIGLTYTVIQEMAKHPDLAKIAALDTFLGNADRSPPNLFYDNISDRFCGIDMAAAFSSPLALSACNQLRAMKKEHFTDKELAALQDYVDTLAFLVETWPPERQERALLEYSERAGFKKGNPLFDQDVADRIEFHKQCIKDNYENSIELIKIMVVVLPYLL